MKKLAVAVLGLSSAAVALWYIFLTTEETNDRVAEPMVFYEDLARGATGDRKLAWEAFLSGAPGSSEKSFRLFLPLAEQGMPDAQFIVGIYFHNGIAGVLEKDRVQAYMWCSLVAANAQEKYWRDLGARNRDLIALSLTPEEIAQGRKLVREWKPKPGQS